MAGKTIQQQRRMRKRRWGKKGPNIKRDHCYVYFIEATVGDMTFVKIGFTSDCATRRLKVLQLGSPVELRLLGFFEGIQQDEIDLHKRFSHLWSHREWFRVDAELAAVIDGICIGGDQ